MNKIKISENLKRNYEDYYEEGNSEWRWIGAIDKAKNILTLCKDLSINSVVEIGAGEGSILKRLSELNFAEEFYALEISASGVETINHKNIPNLKKSLLIVNHYSFFKKLTFYHSIKSHIRTIVKNDSYFNLKF